MITEQQLKQDCTPELIKKMVELAEGFRVEPNGLIVYKPAGIFSTDILLVAICKSAIDKTI